MILFYHREMPRYRATAIRQTDKYAGNFEADNLENARQKLTAQGYEILTLSEIRPSWPVFAGISLLLIFIAAAGVWMITAMKPKAENPVQNYKRPAGSGSKRGKTLLNVLGTWTKLKSGKFLISTSDQRFNQAWKFKTAGDNHNLKRMFEKQEVGWTSKYGGGQNIYILTWHESEHSVKVKFKENDTLAWVEESAIVL